MGKGSRPRPVDYEKWDNAEYWLNLKRRNKIGQAKESKFDEKNYGFDSDSKYWNR